VLNKLTDAINLLERNGSLYSGRPILTMAGVLCGWDATLPFQNGPALRSMRRFMHSALGTKGHIAKFEGMEGEIVHIFLRRVLKTPHRIQEEIRRYANEFDVVATGLFVPSIGSLLQ
jgi:hypothetical protein